MKHSHLLRNSTLVCKVLTSFGGAFHGVGTQPKNKRQEMLTLSQNVADEKTGTSACERVRVRRNESINKEKTTKPHWKKKICHGVVAVCTESSKPPWGE